MSGGEGRGGGGDWSRIVPDVEDEASSGPATDPSAPPAWGPADDLALDDEGGFELVANPNSVEGAALVHGQAHSPTPVVGADVPGEEGEGRSASLDEALLNPYATGDLRTGEPGSGDLGRAPGRGRARAGSSGLRGASPREGSTGGVGGAIGEPARGRAGSRPDPSARGSSASGDVGPGWSVDRPAGRIGAGGGPVDADPRPPSRGSARGGLELPPPPVERASGVRRPTPQSARLPDAVPRTLFEEQASRGRPARASPRGREFPTGWAIGAVGLALVAAVVGYAATRPAAVPTGMISIASDPDGAEIYVDGRAIGQTTPHQMFDVPVGDRLQIEVRKAGYVVEPIARSVELVADGAATAYFSLVQIAPTRVSSTPPGAEVSVDGARVAGFTPLVLAELESGQAVDIEVRLAGHLPAKVRHVASLEASEVQVTLEPAVQYAITSEPSDAQVWVDGEEVARTPVYDLMLEAGKRHAVRVQLPGFSPRSRTVRGDAPGELHFALKEQPLRALPLKGADRAEARRLDRELKRAVRRLDRARRIARLAERRLEAIAEAPGAIYSQVAKAQTAADRSAEAAAAAEEALIEVRAKTERFRARVLDD